MKYTFTLLSFLFLFSCGKPIVYSETKTFENSIWEYNNPASFEFEIGDTTERYDLILNIVHDLEFGNQNFYTKFQTIYPSSEKVEDIVSMELSSPFGKWLGDCSSNTCEIGILLQGSTYFKSTGVHKITIEQFTRKSHLEGIQELEFQLIKSE